MQSTQRGREPANAQGVKKEKRNWQNLMDMEEEMDETTNHQNQETCNEIPKDKTGVTETKLKTPKPKTDLFADHFEFMRQMEDRLQNKINEIQNMTLTEKAIKEAKEMSNSPFTSRVLAVPKPKKFHMPQMKEYDETIDPIRFLHLFRQLMILKPTDDDLLCKVFPRMLIGATAIWFSQLESGTMYSFEQLMQKFFTQFIYHQKQKNTMGSLMKI